MIQDQIIDIIAGVLKVDRAQITLESAVGDVPSWDSLAQLSILQSVQDEFDVEFEPEEMMDIENVGDIVKTVEAKNNEKCEMRNVK